MKYINGLILIVSTTLLGGCFLFLNSQKIYNEKISKDETLTISHTFYRDHRMYFVRLFTKKDVLLSFEVNDAPQRFVINKLTNNEGQNFTYRLVTDTSDFQLKCLEYNFLPVYCNKQVLSTFKPISDKEKFVFYTFSQVLQEKLNIPLNNQEINRFIGWVKIYY